MIEKTKVIKHKSQTINCYNDHLRPAANVVISEYCAFTAGREGVTTTQHQNHKKLDDSSKIAKYDIYCTESIKVLFIFCSATIT
jgi:hypothetical protein